MAAPDLRPETRSAVAAVGRALELVRDRSGAEDVQVKGPQDLVTATDVAVEDLLRDALDGPLVGEERGGAAGDGSYWLVDPICGTQNFAFDVPLYCVNVALVEEGRVTASVVGQPNGEILVAERERGAWTSEGRRLVPSDQERPLCVEVSKSEGDRLERAIEFLGRAIRASRWDLRALSSTLSLAYVADGRLAAYVLLYTTAVHSAAGRLLAEEAGAVVTDIDGLPWTLDSDSVLAAATPALHRDLLALLAR